ALQDRWAPILQLPEGARRVELASAALRDKVRTAFAVAAPGWTTAVLHNPDLMIAAASAEAIQAGDFLWVLCELHPGMNTLRYATWVDYHPTPSEMRRAMRTDAGRPSILFGPTGSWGGTPARLSNVLNSPDDTHVIYASDTSGYDPQRVLFVGECD